MPGKGAGLGCWVTRCLLLIAGAAFMATGDDRLSRIRGYLATARFTLTAREWRGVLSQYRFRCENGHASSQSGASLLRLVRGARGLLRCRQCWVKQMMPRIHETAGSAGGQCLSKRYCGKSAHYRFVCAAGHKFESTAASVLADHWCAKCSTERRAERRRYGNPPVFHGVQK